MELRLARFSAVKFVLLHVFSGRTETLITVYLITAVYCVFSMKYVSAVKTEFWKTLLVMSKTYEQQSTGMLF